MRAMPVQLLAAMAVLAACGGGGGGDPSVHHDAGSLDAAAMPPPPVPGAQISRVGRPAVSTLLIGTFATEPTRSAVKDAYRQASDPAVWATTMLPTNVSIEKEIETNLAVFDALDTGLTSVPAAGCGNLFRYTTPPGPTSYLSVADLFADDELLIDTAKPTCTGFLAVELDYGSIGMDTHTNCGGRTPTHDAIDMMYSVLAAGQAGVASQSNGDLTPLIHDNAPAHGDVKETFPFLGPPH